MSNPQSSLCKRSSNKFSSDNSNVLTDKIGFCFRNRNFSPLIQIQLDCKQILLDVNWFNKTIWKSALSKAMRDVLLYHISVLKTRTGLLTCQ